MKKVFLIFFTSLIMLFVFSGTAKAEPLCIDPSTGIKDNSVKDFLSSKGKGLVPCGSSSISSYDYAIYCRYKITYKSKVYSKTNLLNNGSIVVNYDQFSANAEANAELKKIVANLTCPPFDPKTQGATASQGTIMPVLALRNTKLLCPCQISHFFVMIVKALNFAIWQISLPLAGLLIVIGGLLLLVSGGNPGLAGTAKTILKLTIIGLILIFGSYLIIDVVLKTIGYALQWNAF